MDSVFLAGLLAVVSKNLVETLKHLANVGGSNDKTYTRLKGLYTLLAPTLLASMAYLSAHQGATIDLLGSFGVNVASPTTAAVVSGILAGFVAPEAYDLQGLLKGKAKIARSTAQALD